MLLTYKTKIWHGIEKEIEVMVSLKTYKVGKTTKKMHGKPRWL